MSNRRVRTSTPLLCVASLAILACDRSGSVSARDSAGDSARLAQSARDASANWASELGPILVVPADTESAGVVLFPEDPSPRLVASGPLTLLNAAGDSTSAPAQLVVSDSQVCGEAPVVQLAGAATDTWSVGLLGRPGRVIPMDSIEELPSADSARVAADIARLASTLPMPSESRFGGLPFVVLAARRFDVNGRQTLVAHVMRRVPQEAAPLEEHTLLIAERASPADRLEPAFHARSEGGEETTDRFEVLSAIRGDSTIYLIVARDRAARTLYEVLERGSSGGWRVRWSRALSC